MERMTEIKAQGKTHAITSMKPHMCTTALNASHVRPPSSLSSSSSLRILNTSDLILFPSSPSIAAKASAISVANASSVPSTVGPRKVGLPIAEPEEVDELWSSKRICHTSTNL